MLPLFVIYTIFSIIGIIFAVICLIFNLWFRNQKYVCILFIDSKPKIVILCRLVKLGSPYINIMMVAGAIMFYTIVILFGIDENVASHTTVDGLCHARIWLVSIGFSLLYGTIFAKTWRVHYIFNYAKPNSKFVSI